MRQEAVNVVFAAAAKAAFQNNENAGNGANITGIQRPRENHDDDDHRSSVRCLLTRPPSLASLFLPVLMRLDKKLSVFDRVNAPLSLDNGWFYVAAIENTNLR